MKRNEEHLWSAYLDGELSATDASAYDAGLSEADRARMEAEMRLESAMADALRDESPCPLDVWKRIVQDVHCAARKRDRWRATAAHWGVPAFAAAAGIFVAFALYFPAGPNSLPPFLELAVANEPEMRQVSPAELDRAMVEDLLRQTGVDLSLAPKVDLSHHRMEFVDASKGIYGDRNYVRLLFLCCGQPVKIIITPEDTPAAAAIEKAFADGEFTGDTRRTGGCIIAAVGDARHAPEVLSLIQVL